VHLIDKIMTILLTIIYIYIYIYIYNIYMC